jgi:hypothetical protein
MHKNSSSGVTAQHNISACMHACMHACIADVAAVEQVSRQFDTLVSSSVPR